MGSYVFININEYITSGKRPRTLPINIWRLIEDGAVIIFTHLLFGIRFYANLKTDKGLDVTMKRLVTMPICNCEVLNNVS